MKNLILFSAIQFLVSFGAYAKANAITEWETTIPVTQEQAIQMIDEKAADLVYRDDDSGVICGGQTDRYELADYFTSEAYDGLVTHSMLVRFQVTVPVDFCSTEVIKTCEVNFEATSENDVQLANWNCQ